MRLLPLPLRVPVPSVEAPSLKVTVPVGAVPVTVAVRVVVAPIVEGLTLLVRAVVLGPAQAGSEPPQQSAGGGGRTAGR